MTGSAKDAAAIVEELRRREPERDSLAIGELPGLARRRQVTRRDLEAVGRLAGIARERFAALGVEPSLYRSKRRHRELAWARADVAHYLAQLTPRPSFPVIARCVGLSDHTSAIHAVREHQKRIENRKEGDHHVEEKEATKPRQAKQ